LKRNERSEAKRKNIGSEIKRKETKKKFFFSREHAKRISFRFEAKNFFGRNRRTLAVVAENIMKIVLTPSFARQKSFQTAWACTIGLIRSNASHIGVTKVGRGLKIFRFLTIPLNQ
jgi:hypothetical protein